MQQQVLADGMGASAQRDLESDNKWITFVREGQAV